MGATVGPSPLPRVPDWMSSVAAGLSAPTFAVYAEQGRENLNITCHAMLCHVMS